MISGILGGVGIFLLGMVLLTEGLKAAAGDALRALIQNVVRSPGRGILAGTAVTALVQSSSATTLATIGFVSAGLLTFPQAVGVIFGANLGTTSTGWLVSIVGLKVSLSALAYPLVGIGALLRLLARGRLAHGGMAIAGFGLIFVGIGVLQGGMEALALRIDPGSLPGGSFLGRAGLVGVGIVMTILLQSSSVAVATTLTGLHAGTIGIEQAALLVIGQNVGTTANAALASIGGSIPVKRTALAHILFNAFTAAVALTLFPFLLDGARWVAAEEDPAFAVALFHSAFNLLGVLLLLPFLAPFSRLIERVVGEEDGSLTRYLDPSVTQIPSVAIEAARRSETAVAERLFDRAMRVLRREEPRGGAGTEAALQPPVEALGEIREFLAAFRTPTEDARARARHISLLHVADHLDGFLGALRDFEALPQAGWADGVEEGAGWLADALAQREGNGESGLAQVSEALARLRKTHRVKILEATAHGTLAPGQAWDDIEALKTLDRIGYHAWRAVHHLSVADPTPGTSMGRMESELFPDRENGSPS